MMARLIDESRYVVHDEQGRFLGYSDLGVRSYFGQQEVTLTEADFDGRSYVGLVVVKEGPFSTIGIREVSE